MDYVVLLVLGAIDAAGYSVIAPVLPAVSSATGAGPATMGALVAMFPLGIIVGFPVAGRAIKRSSASTLVLVSLAFLGIGSFGFAVGHGAPVLFAMRFVMGIGSGFLWIAITFGTLERWPGQEYVCMSRIFAAYSVGGLLGPGLGALGGVRTPFLAYLVIVCAAIPLALLLRGTDQRVGFRSDPKALRLPGFWLASAGILFAVLGLGIVEGVLPLHFGTRLAQSEIAALYVGMSLVVAVAAAAAGQFAPRQMLAAAAFLIVAGIALAGAARAVPVWLGAMLIAGAGIGMGNTGSIGVLLEAVSAERIVTAMVLWSELGIVGYLLGPLAGGAVVAAWGFAVIGLVPLVASVAVIVGLWLRPGQPRFDVR